VRFRKQEVLLQGIQQLSTHTALSPMSAFTPEVKILTSCPSCLQGLSRFSGDTGAQADYIVVELARKLLGEDWMPAFVARANQGGIERVLL
jgi:Fe-S oxidoreductase